MTFQDIVNDVVDRVGTANALEFTRIGRYVNLRHKELVSSIGLETSVRTVVTANTIIGNNQLVFAAEKLFAVYDATVDPPNVLNELTLDEIRNGAAFSGIAQNYAIYLMGASTVTIYLDATPTTIYPLTADAEANVATMSATDVPSFPADYHDLLVYGALASELEKRAQYDLAQVQENRYLKRCGDLRMFIAKSGYLSIYQGKTAGFGYANLWPPLI